MANLLTNQLSINAISCCTPLITLFWLCLPGQTHVERPDHLIIGASTIELANTAINIKQLNRTAVNIAAAVLRTTAIALYLTHG